MTMRIMKIVNGLRLIGYGIAIAALDLAIDMIDANKAFVKAVKSLL
jgi:hypothetical protein